MKQAVVPILLISASTAFARNPKIAADLEGTARNAAVDVIVQFKITPGPAHQQRMMDRAAALKAHLGFANAAAMSPTFRPTGRCGLPARG